MRIPYKKIPKKVLAGTALAALLGLGAAQLAIDTEVEFEGYVPSAYQDPVGIWTKCFGDTRDVVPGATYTFEECVDSLNEHTLEIAQSVMRCVPGLASKPDKVKAPALSMAYNIGPSSFCKSSVARYFNAGDWERGCKRMAEIYTSAKGRTLPGLVRRRNHESQLCLEGLREGS